MEEMVLVVERESPETPYRGRLILGEGHGVSVVAVEALTAAVEVLIEILGLRRLVDEDVRLADRGAREIVGAEGRAVRLRAPVLRKLESPVPELEQRIDEVLVRLDSYLRDRGLDLRVLCGSGQHCLHFRVARFLTG